MGLDGQLPQDDSVWTALSTLTSLDLSNNQLTGDIPAELNNLQSLQRLSLGGNQLQGTLPQLQALQGLTLLDASKNQITGGLTGYHGKC